MSSLISILRSDPNADDGRESPCVRSLPAVAGEEVGVAHGADSCHMDVLPLDAAAAQGVHVRRPQVEVGPDRAGSEEGLRMRPDPPECRLNHLLAHLIAVRPDRWADAGHQVLCSAAEPLHPVHQTGDYPGHSGPPRGMGKPHGPGPAIGHEDQGAVSALAHEAQARHRGAEPVCLALKAPAFADQDLSAVNLLQERGPSEIQHTGDLLANPIRVMTDGLDIRSLSCGHQVGDVEWIERGEPPYQPTLVQGLQPEASLVPYATGRHGWSPKAANSADPPVAAPVLRGRRPGAE